MINEIDSAFNTENFDSVRRRKKEILQNMTKIIFAQQQFHGITLKSIVHCYGKGMSHRITIPEVLLYVAYHAVFNTLVYWQQ